MYKMYKKNSSKKYLQNRVESASPGTLVLMLFDGAVRYLNISKARLSMSMYQSAFENKVKAQNIIYELSSCLNMDSGELAESLYRSYDYMLDKLINVEMTVEHLPEIDEVINLLTELRDAWNDMLKTHEQDNYATTPAAPLYA